jgi:hypothetical protein
MITINDAPAALREKYSDLIITNPGVYGAADLSKDELIEFADDGLDFSLADYPLYLVMAETYLDEEVTDGMPNRTWTDEDDVVHVRTWREWRDATHTITVSIDNSVAMFSMFSYGVAYTLNQVKACFTDASIDIYGIKSFGSRRATGEFIEDPDPGADDICKTIRREVMNRANASAKRVAKEKTFKVIFPDNAYIVFPNLLYVNYFRDTCITEFTAITPEGGETSKTVTPENLLAVKEAVEKNALSLNHRINMVKYMMIMAASTVQAIDAITPEMMVSIDGVDKKILKEQIIVNV